MWAIGVDLDPAMIEVAAERWPTGEFHVADATALPLDDGSVTGYRADKILHALPEPERAVTEARRVLAKNGRAAPPEPAPIEDARGHGSPSPWWTPTKPE
ncbi:methyltransferase domain-containing protein [Actinomadura macra]|uniref:methyltransferase domain-containing protein n=1 Tax=Actinomadura macra TaxID=46164 RepID=UPI001C3F2520|nr:methyltransferase domain-containing protein [Actinomadura macra]